MKILAMAWVSLGLLVGCGGEEPAAMVDSGTEVAPATAPDEAVDAFDEAAATRRAKSAIMMFAGSLQAEFGAAMNSGGPVEAIEVCNTRAAAIARDMSEEYGLKLGRVSLRNRSPANAPNEWQAAVLMEFEKRHQTGEDPAYVSWSQVAGEGEDREFRFMKPIPTHDLCLNCHGTSIAPDVQAKIDRYYPDDLATGFSVGELRGAFVATMPATP